jgi:type I restriction enzyme R subunit
MAERAKAVRENYEDRQTSTAEALAELTKEIESNERRKREQAEKGFDGLTYFVYSTLREADIPNAEIISKRIRTAFVEHPNWATSERELREVRQKITFAIFPEEDNFEKVATVVDHLLTLLMKAQGTQA